MVTAIFPAAGASRRMNIKTNKNFLEIGGEPVLIRTLKIFSQSERINFLIVVVAESEISEVEKLLSAEKNLKSYKIVVGGSERQYSIANALKFIPEDAEIILVHDAARPLINLQTIENVIDAAEKFGGAIAAVPAKNTIKFVDAENFVKNTPPRSELVEVQTPQGFKKNILIRAYAEAEKNNFLGTDDASLVERIGEKIKIVPSDYKNIKITTPEDLKIAEAILMDNEQLKIDNSIINYPLSIINYYRTGFGYDVHKLVENRKLILGGVEIPHNLGLAGHSDADVLIHAIIDAILGAAALGDIGQHFPDTDPNFKDIDSTKLLKKVCELIQKNNFVIENIDSTIVAQKPKLSPYISKIRQKLSEVLQIDFEKINVKAKTEEGLGFTGSELGIKSYAVANLKKILVEE